jgi:hypothetical protein
MCDVQRLSSYLASLPHSLLHFSDHFFLNPSRAHTMLTITGTSAAACSLKPAACSRSSRSLQRAARGRLAVHAAADIDLTQLGIGVSILVAVGGAAFFAGSLNSGLEAVKTALEGLQKGQEDLAKALGEQSKELLAALGEQRKELLAALAASEDRTAVRQD